MWRNWLYFAEFAIAIVCITIILIMPVIIATTSLAMSWKMFLIALQVIGALVVKNIEKEDDLLYSWIVYGIVISFLIATIQ